jgi:hypothetical protein
MSDGFGRQKFTRFVARPATGSSLPLRLTTGSEQKPGCGPWPRASVPVARGTRSEVLPELTLACRATMRWRPRRLAHPFVAKRKPAPPRPSALRMLARVRRAS